MKRLLTAVFLIPVVLYGVFWGPPWVLLAFIGVVALLSFTEYCQILHVDLPARALGIVAGAGLLWIPIDAVFLPLLVFLLLAFALQLNARDFGAGFTRSAAMFFGVLYTFGALKTAFLLSQRSPWWLFFALGINWIGDSGAFYIGQRFGRHKLAPRVSPNKSWEGTAASLVFSLVFGMLLLPRLLHIPIPTAMLLALAGNAAGQIGDLAESALKRGAGVKDSGTLLPGHGGMLDRVDSMLFTLPVIYGLVSVLY